MLCVMTTVSEGAAQADSTEPLRTAPPLPFRWSRFAGMFVLAAWMTWIGIAAVCAPSQESATDFRTAATTQDIVRWRWSPGPPQGLMSSSGYAVGGAMDSMSQVPGGVIVWLDRANHPHWIEVPDVAGSVDHNTSYSSDLQRRSVTEWLTKQVGPDSSFSLERRTAASTVGLAFGLAALAFIVFGPRPVRGTRWYWFWIAGVPLGLGFAAYAVRELMHPEVVRPRRSGFDGFVTTIICGFVLAGLTMTAAWLVPRL